MVRHFHQQYPLIIAVQNNLKRHLASSYPPTLSHSHHAIPTNPMAMSSRTSVNLLLQYPPSIAFLNRAQTSQATESGGHGYLPCLALIKIERDAVLSSSWKSDFWFFPSDTLFQMVINNSRWRFRSCLLWIYRVVQGPERKIDALLASVKWV